MRQFTLTQLLMSVTLVAILSSLVVLACETRRTMVTSLDFSADGSRLVAARLDVRSGNEVDRQNFADACRTISAVDVEKAAVIGLIEQAAKPGKQGESDLNGTVVSVQLS